MMSNSTTTDARIPLSADLLSMDPLLTDPPSEGLAPRLLALLIALEISLSRSQKALLARDLSGIQRGVREQTILYREIKILSRSDAPAPASESYRAEIFPRQARILHLARVQAALLMKAQRSLLMIASLAGALGTSYAPPPWPATSRAGLRPE
jgi:hypothetical protein